MFKAEDFISQKPSFKFQHYTSESHINTIEILYILESHFANSLCWPLIFKNAIIRADSLSLPCSAWFSPMILCAARSWILIQLRVSRQPSIGRRYVSSLIFMSSSSTSARSRCSVSKHGALIAERVSENYYIDGAFLRGLSAQQSLFVLSE